MACRGYILTEESLDFSGKHEIRYSGICDQGPFEILIDKERPLFFVESENNSLPLKFSFEQKKVPLKTMKGLDVDAVYFQTWKDLCQAKEDLEARGIRTYEADIRPGERFRMERFIGSEIEFEKGDQPLKRILNPPMRPAQVNLDLSVLSLDIETGQNGELYSIGLHQRTKNDDKKIVLMVGPSDQTPNLSYLTYFDNEKDLLIDAIKIIQDWDPDFIAGWHIVGFDFSFLYDKCEKLGIEFAIGRGKTPIRFFGERRSRCHIRGRQVIDGPPVLRTCFFRFENYKLDTVAKEVLGDGKDIEQSGTDKVKEIERRFKEDKEALAKYNLLDCTLVLDILEKLKLIELLMARSRMSGMLLDKIGASIKAFDHFYLPRLHRKGHVANNAFDIDEGTPNQGGHVIEPEGGLHESVVVLDFKSLYPSIIRTFSIDPLSYIKSDIEGVTTPVGISFSKSVRILPDFIQKLMDLRAQAKVNQDAPLSQAIKILMNSFYGVMGAKGSRFYNADIAEAITGTGRWILKTTANLVRDENLEVLYGDTDSLFIKLKKDQAFSMEKIGGHLELQLSQKLKKLLAKDFYVESFLELEHEKSFRKIYFPMNREGTGVAKKRYVGLLNSGSTDALSFVGMEFIRSDWTALAKKLQYGLFERLFSDSDIEKFLKDFVKDLKEHKFDDLLVYKKRLSRSVDEYTKQIPPHVKAAKILKQSFGIEPRTIEYIMTLRGPVPVQSEQVDFDYQHYIDKQIRPLAGPLLMEKGKSFNDIITGDQLNLF